MRFRFALPLLLSGLAAVSLFTVASYAQIPKVITADTIETYPPYACTVLQTGQFNRLVTCSKPWRMDRC